MISWGWAYHDQAERDISATARALAGMILKDGEGWMQYSSAYLHISGVMGSDQDRQTLHSANE